MDALTFFSEFWERVRATPHWHTMANTVENSPWHREANVAVHTTMTIDQYLNNFFDHRNERERVLTLMALLFHDFGKPEAEEVLPKKGEDGEPTGEVYRRYAGHEPISGNEFISFMCDQHELREMFFEQGFNWNDIRTIKVMIEHHLPYGLKNVQKRQNLKQMIDETLDGDELCFYDMLRSDCWGRISDDHDTKKANVEEWISEFQTVQWKPRKIPAQDAPTMILVVGVSGAGKSTYIQSLGSHYVVFSEDELRMDYAEQFLDRTDYLEWNQMSPSDRYHVAWKFCHMNKDSKFDAFSKAKFNELLATGKNIIVDRMNQGRKARNIYIQPAKDKGYHVAAIEFYISEQTAMNRQKTRGDKSLADFRVHQIFMQLETPWYGPEVDDFIIVPPSP